MLIVIILFMNIFSKGTKVKLLARHDGRSVIAEAWHNFTPFLLLFSKVGIKCFCSQLSSCSF